MRRVLYRSCSVLSVLIILALFGVWMPLRINLVQGPTEAWATDSSQSKPDQRIPDSLEGDPEAIALGKGIFHTYCWGCHGRNGTGAQCPDFSDDRQLHGDRYEDLVKVVTNGVKGTPMGPWGYALGRQRLLQVVAYVFSLKGTREARRK